MLVLQFLDFSVGKYAGAVDDRCNGPEPSANIGDRGSNSVPVLHIDGEILNGGASFTKPIEPANVNKLRDTSHSMIRTEVRSTHGDSHLGHVFPDGPKDRGGLLRCLL